MLKKSFLLIFIGGISYFFGALTVQYKLFPFSEIVKIRNYVKENSNLINYSPYYLSKVSQFNELKNSNDFSIIMIGDSITDGAEWYELLKNNEVQNRGIGGDTTNGVLDRLDTINKSIKKAFIMIGINDIAGYKEVDEIYNNYTKILENLEKKNIKVYIQSVLFVGTNYPNSVHFNKEVKNLNKKLEKMAKDKNIDFIDLNYIFAPNNYLKRIYTDDEIHLNGKAYILWANEIQKYILE
ncbi:lipolytic protein [Aliarcobacter trophiarum LMG 25534]|uniref:Lipolytic protein n=1 Tax=Aliarcobacter trophiarum LMG 25534 TaxID=1032241 RepID=A0AAD0VMR9_9BACT|nr:GDSL-type esterase/lipase family protein [Aliarcobacter trophiarum]AXK49519.1 sialate O-acetylesterase-like protein [Aliarcobacter trophiarum LMG 25534]RXI27550.1 lipolytic protein [Aliarcobacter trophiarum]RXJ92201.1 lipolytic protein [Aliarcobacter trophiarum LMG 25534]